MALHNQVADCAPFAPPVATAGWSGAVLMEDGRSLNEELVRAGLAWWYHTYALGASTLAVLEAEVRVVE